ncbi:MAG: N-6 DNA methylase [Verrucomicrobiae bacterium]|nr:N-6 DNA methylase [Verrucomicrobiae bacterium]
MNIAALPSSGPAREALRAKGQFWTPEWIADAMTGYVLADGASQLLDPAVGAGVFFRSALRRKPSCDLAGFDVDADALSEARKCGLSARDLRGVRLADFLSHPHRQTFEAITANPPYIRHHRLSAARKDELRRYATRRMGFALDGRIGLHAYFLLKALELLRPGGRLAFILPADVCEGISAKPLWNWIAARYRLDMVITFAPEAAAFPGVDTNALIFFLRAADPVSEFDWVRVLETDPPGFDDWAAGRRTSNVPEGVCIVRRQLDEGLRTGLSRPPFTPQDDGLYLRDFARVMRGIATGANEFFTMTDVRRRELGLAENGFAA